MVTGAGVTFFIHNEIISYNVRFKMASYKASVPRGANLQDGYGNFLPQPVRNWYFLALTVLSEIYTGMVTDFKSFQMGQGQGGWKFQPADLEHRLVIDRGASPRSWQQWLSDRPVVEIRPPGFHSVFPGYISLIIVDQNMDIWNTAFQ
jgi:hypothetical protein